MWQEQSNLTLLWTAQPRSLSPPDVVVRLLPPLLAFETRGVAAAPRTSRDKRYDAFVALVHFADAQRPGPFC